MQDSHRTPSKFTIPRLTAFPALSCHRAKTEAPTEEAPYKATTSETHTHTPTPLSISALAPGVPQAHPLAKVQSVNSSPSVVQREKAESPSSTPLPRLGSRLKLSLPPGALSIPRFPTSKQLARFPPLRGELQPAATRAFPPSPPARRPPGAVLSGRRRLCLDLPALALRGLQQREQKQSGHLRPCGEPVVLTGGSSRVGLNPAACELTAEAGPSWPSTPRVWV